MESLVEYGYWGLFLASFLASTVIPLSSEVILVSLLALNFNPVTCILVATLGNWAGGLTTYGLGYLGKWEWVEKYFKVKKERIEAFHKKVLPYGALGGLVTWLPLVGDLIALSMGFIRTKVLPSMLFMLIGRGARYLFWAYITLKVI